MLNGTITAKPQTINPRHWSPEQSYVTGDVLAWLVGEGWGVRSARPVQAESRARMFLCTLERDGSTMAVRVLDGPFVRSVAQNL